MATFAKITPWLWFDADAHEAAQFYTSVFPNAKIVETTHYGAAGPLPEGTVMTVTFELEGLQFVALNGGKTDFSFNEAMSFQVLCDDQAEVDRYWTALTKDGGSDGRCGWLKDRYGLSWQIVPIRLYELMSDPDPAKAQRATEAMLTMSKIVIADLEAAAASS
jgi:predicted 3-demethylubiquinone-9 3-methyltransferase (glyoxalase superfamily)